MTDNIENRFISLCSKENPDLDDYSLFVSVCEKLPPNILYEIQTKSPSMNWLLRIVLSQNLNAKIQRINVENSLNAIATRFLA